MTTVLVVEDDLDVRNKLEVDIARDGYQVIGVGDGVAALAAAAERPPDLVVLDLNLPGLQGIEVCRRLRQAGMGMPILVLSGHKDITTRVLGLESGADDYVTKPFNTRELLARIRAHLRRFLEPRSASRLTNAGNTGLQIDPISQQAWCEGVEVELTSTEFAVLHLLVRNADQMVSRDTLLTALWGSTEYKSRAIDTHIANLRRKLEVDPAHPQRIVTVHGRGYKYLGGGHSAVMV